MTSVLAKRLRFRGALAVLAIAVLAVLGRAASDPEQLIAFLNQTLVWYRQSSAQEQLAKEISDVLYVNSDRQIADQVVRLCFDFARAQAQLATVGQAAGTAGAQPTDTVSSQYQILTGMVNKADQQVKESQAEVDRFRGQVAAASGARRRTLESTLTETQAELDLMQARRDTLHNMLQFMSSTRANGKTAGLQSEIEELARGTPAASAQSGAAASPSAAAPTPPANPVSARPQPTGILGISRNVFALRRKLGALDQAAERTDALSQAVNGLRTPLGATLKQFVAQGDAIISEPDSTDPKALAQQKQQLDGLTSQFKQLSASVLPLAKASVLLDLYQRNIGNWRAIVAAEYSSEVKALTLRVAILGLVLAVVIAIFEFWRRATFRYVHDSRRRYQFLVIRRILLWSVIIIIVAFSFASELGSLATFAGLLTAGVAVALQNVILSVAGYFFLIGKYGVRVGDRVQIQGVTGDVADIGLVRMHLMELGGMGSGAAPTGRMVAFSNAVVFQANAGMFKQIPGTRVVWHEVRVTLASGADHHRAEKRVLAEVHEVFADYRENMERQRRNMEHALTPLTVSSLHPESRLRLVPGGVELIVRYPVELDHAREMDDRITRAVIEATRHEPKLQVAGARATVAAVEEEKG